MPRDIVYAVQTERETDGRWIAEVPALPGVLAYGTSESEAQARAQALALRVLAEQLEHDETDRSLLHLAFQPA